MSRNSSMPKAPVRGDTPAGSPATATSQAAELQSKRPSGRPAVQLPASQQGRDTPAISGGGDVAALTLVLRLEAFARAAGDIAELRHLIANETRKINRARQIFVIELDRTAAASVSAVTGVTTPDAQSVLISGIEATVHTLARERGLEAAADFTLPAYSDPHSEVATSYPFREFAWLPFLDRRGHVFAGMLAARETPWSKDDVALTARLAGAYAHAWRELATSGSFRPPQRITRWRMATAAAAVLALAFPVPITALAPAEIVAADPLIIAAPIDGAIEQIVPDPSGKVAAGDVLVRLADTTLRNRAEVAQREVAVAQAKLKQSTMLAFGDARGRHEMGLAQAELDLKRADLALANELLERTVIRSSRAGIAVYPDRRHLIGKPVATGERIMEIADPAAIEVRIDLALPDAIALKQDSHVKLFLDVDPLRPVPARVFRSDYQARASDSDVLAFRTFARLEQGSDGAVGLPRIGLRGTAQVWGDSAPLLIVLLRRPISAARQWLGL
jgi:hypothetical protein